MRNFLRVLALGLVLAFAGAAHAQTAVQQSQSRLDASTGVGVTTVAIGGAQGTQTITPGSGQCVYIDSLQVTVGQDATGTTAANQFTSTNLNGWAHTLWSTVIASGGSANYNSGELIGSAPLRSATCGTAVTIVTPALATHNGYEILTHYHFGLQNQGG